MHARRNHATTKLATALGLLVLVISGCSRVRQTMGLSSPPIPMQPGNPVPLPRGEDPDENPSPGALAPGEWKRLESIQQRLEKTQTLSSWDIAYAAHLLHSKPPLETFRVERERLALVELSCMRPKILPPAQSRQLFDTVLPYTNSVDLEVKVDAILELASSQDPRAIGVLHRHVKNDRSDYDRKLADAIEQRLRLIFSSKILVQH